MNDADTFANWYGYETFAQFIKAKLEELSDE